MCMCNGTVALIATALMVIEVPLLVIGLVNWQNPVPRPGVVLAALLAATTSTMVASAVTIAASSNLHLQTDAHRSLALAGAALTVLVHIAARRPRPRAVELIAAARTITDGTRRM